MMLAVELANNSQFGLGSEYSREIYNVEKKLALQLEAGSSFVNKL
jgi:succinate-semialdehyde dehydrogenase/glutarate-semialdehyde dehydrogenase